MDAMTEWVFQDELRLAELNVPRAALHLARAIAASSVPVLTGIGHEIDSSIADLVAHRAWKTPTCSQGFGHQGGAGRGMAEAAVWCRAR